MKVLHLSPSYFDPNSVIGGGERYAYELAKAMSRKAEVRFVSFGGKSSCHKVENLTVRILSRSDVWGVLMEIIWADIIHCHQIYRWQTDFAIIAGKLLGRKVFATDLGGFSAHSLEYHFPILKFLNGLLLISKYSKELMRKRLQPSSLPKLMDVIGGGVDLEKFRPRPGVRRKKILFVGRILPHKGIDVLLDAATPEMEIDIVGKPYDENYLKLLIEKASGKNVHFLHDVSDTDLTKKYSEALVTVSPSVYKTCFGFITDAPELLGLTALESMACATPVIVSRTASLPELVREGETGFVVPERDPQALREKLLFFFDHPEASEVMGKKALLDIMRNFTWEITAEKCLDHYRNINKTGVKL